MYAGAEGREKREKSFQMPWIDSTLKDPNARRDRGNARRFHRVDFIGSHHKLRFGR